MTTKTRLKPVTRAAPCPVCEGNHKCSRGEDGVILCGRSSGPAPGFTCLGQARGDSQFTLYRREGDPALQRDRPRIVFPSRRQATVTADRPSVDWQARAEQLAGSLTADLADELAEALGLPRLALEAMHQLGYIPEESCWTFPELDGRGLVVGIVRRYRDGKKKALAGSGRGLSVPSGWADRPGPVLIVEGASDVLALTASALPAIGRPSNTGGVDQLADQLRTLPAEREIVVLGEHDRKPNGMWPGRDGAASVAERLAEKLRRPIAWALPPDEAKDMRSWLTSKVPERDLLDAWHTAGEELVSILDKVICNRKNTVMASMALRPYNPFPLACLPDPLRSYVSQAAAALGVDPAYVALPALAVCAAAIGNTRVIQLKRGWREPCVLWVALVADSGCLKSPALDAAVKPLYRVQKTLLEQYDLAMRQYALDRLAAKESKGPPPEEPVPRRLLVSDTTLEKLGHLLSQNPRGLLLARDELAGWFGSFQRYKTAGSSDLPAWLELHRAGHLLIDRKTGEPRTLHVPRASVSVAGSIQPGILRRCLTGEAVDSGLAARLLLAMPPRSQRVWREVEISPDTEERYRQLLEGLLALSFKDNREEPFVLDLDGEGKKAWVEFYNAWGHLQRDAEGARAALLAKLEGAAARLALLHHVVTHTGLAVDDRRPVSAASVRAAADLVAWLEAEASRVYAVLGESDEHRDQRRLVELIQQRGGTISTRELMRCRRYASAEDAENALNALVEAGLGSWRDDEVPARGGHRRRCFVLTPAAERQAESVDTCTALDGEGVNSPAKSSECQLSTVNGEREGAGAWLAPGLASEDVQTPFEKETAR